MALHKTTQTGSQNHAVFDAIGRHTALFNFPAHDVGGFGVLIVVKTFNE